MNENAEFTFKLGIVDGKVISIDEIKQLATMPGREELFSRLLYLINAPAQRLATVIAATGRDLAVVVNQAVEQNKFAGAAAPAAEAKAAPAPEAAAPEAAAAPAAEASAVAGESSAIAEGAAPDVTGAPQADPAQPETGEASQAQSASTEAPAEG